MPDLLTELAVLATIRDRLEKVGAHVVVSDPDLIAVCADKRETASFFQARDLPTPQIFDVDQIRYPALVKPFNGSLSAGVRVLRDADELTPALRQDPSNIFCAYIDHATHDEFTVDLYYDRNGALKCVGMRVDGGGQQQVTLIARGRAVGCDGGYFARVIKADCDVLRPT